MAAIPKPVLTVDIVDFSLRSGDEQMKAIKKLIELLNEAIPEDQNNSAARIWSPAGDGGSITFWDDIHAALKTAISLGKLISEHNRKLPKGAQELQVRMGLHSGTITKEKDFDNRENVWGDGMNVSARVASLAQPGQILASKEFYEQADLRTRTKQEVTPLGKWWAKHNKAVELYNIYMDGAGLSPSEIEEWLGPFHYPLEHAIRTYEAMAEEQASEGPAFRAAVLAKRLLDLDPEHKRAREIIRSISITEFPDKPGAQCLYDAFFSYLSPSALLHFFQNAVFRTFERGKYICKEGDRAVSMMMVVSGEIVPLIGGQTIGIILREGEIIGEMGLFNPGEKRTATLRAEKKSITLSLDYRFLKEVEGDEYENKKRVEIRERIWDSYCKRTRENQINQYPLFQILPDAERRELIKESTFLPAYYEESIQLEPKDVWDYWVMVVAGNVIASTADKRKVEFKKGDCLGPIRCAVTEPVYTEVEVSPRAQLIRLPWKLIDKFRDTYDEFFDECMKEGGQARRHCKI